MGWCAGACDSAQRPQQGDGDRAAAGMVQAIVMAVGGVPGVEGMGGEGAECHGGVAGALHAAGGLERLGCCAWARLLLQAPFAPRRRSSTPTAAAGAPSSPVALGLLSLLRCKPQASTPGTAVPTCCGRLGVCSRSTTEAVSAACEGCAAAVGESAEERVEALVQRFDAHAESGVAKQGSCRTASTAQPRSRHVSVVGLLCTCRPRPTCW